MVSWTGWTLAVALREEVGNFLSRFCSVFVFGGGSLVMHLRYTSGQIQVESVTLSHSALGFLWWPFGQLVSSLILVPRLFISQCDITAVIFSLDLESQV